jgi:hypothetical protein
VDVAKPTSVVVVTTLLHFAGMALLLLAMIPALRREGGAREAAFAAAGVISMAVAVWLTLRRPPGAEG